MIIKNFKNYLFEKINLQEIKKHIINTIIKTIDKYDLPYFLLGTKITVDNQDYYINSFNKKGDTFFLDFDIEAENKNVNIVKLNTKLLIAIWEDIKENNRLEPEYLLETLQGGYLKSFKAILIKTKRPIKFDSYIFNEFYANNNEDILKTYNFQNFLFRTHPEAALSFLESDTKILPTIISKYNLQEIVDDYEMRQNAKKFNI